MFPLLHALRCKRVSSRLPRQKIDSELATLATILIRQPPQQSYNVLKNLPIESVVLYAFTRAMAKEALVVLRQSLLAGLTLSLQDITTILVNLLEDSSWLEPSPVISIIADYYCYGLDDAWLTLEEIRSLLPPTSIVPVLVVQCLCLIFRRNNGCVHRGDARRLFQMALSDHCHARAIIYASLGRPAMAVLASYDDLFVHRVRRPTLVVRDLVATRDTSNCFLTKDDALLLFDELHDYYTPLAAALVQRLPLEVVEPTLVEACTAGTIGALLYLNAVAESHPIVLPTVKASNSPLGDLLVRRLNLLMASPRADENLSGAPQPSGFLASFGSWFRRALGSGQNHTGHRSSRGIRILTLDGGGSRSLLTITVLKALTRYLPCHQIGAFFDLIVGTSAGGLVALGIGCLNLPLQMSSTVAREISVAAFSKGGALGLIEKLVRILIKGEKHDSRAMTEHLRQVYGELSMVDTTALCGSTTKVAVVTALTNVSPPEPFLFRNYTYGPDSPSRYQGDHSVAIYHCARATTAAPVYFSPVVLHDGRVIQDGALVANNPAHLALHEAARIFPGRAVDCLVSVGTGRVPIEKLGATYTAKTGFYAITRDLLALVYSATSTEVTSNILDDIMSPEVYFRLQPDLPRALELDEVADESLDELVRIAEEYVARPAVERQLRRIAAKLMDDFQSCSKL